MILETPRLYLRHFKEEDAFRLSEYRNKKEVAYYQTWNKYSILDAKRRIAHCLRNPEIKEKGNYQFAIVLKESHLLIGDLFVETNKSKSFVLGYTLDSDYWNLGFASEIVNEFLEYMKEEYHYQKAICYVYKDNERSLHLLKKLNFKKFSESYFYDDEGYVKVL
ncbi:MAG: GNAT family N-acetyltransferase [Bacilli bacterium]|nr:GNAT family N-acetyltransferase [Bacilli bacterium]